MRRKQFAVLLGTAVMSASVVLPCAAEDAGAAATEVLTEAGSEAASDLNALPESEEAAGEETADQETALEAEPVPEANEPVPELDDFVPEIPEVEYSDDAGEDDQIDNEASEEAMKAKQKVDEKKAASEKDVVDKDGLIEDDGTVTSDSVEGDPEVSLEELWDDQMHNRQFPGFEVDPSRYPAANITVNTVVLYRFLTREMDLNHAAACGVLANVQLESNFRPLALGDSGTSYGICQWHNGRFTSLMNYCKSHDLDYNTLEGQIAYLKWDLTHGYKGVYEALKKVENTPEGAYKAGFLFCWRFEIPDQVAARSKRRGNLAREEYYDKDFDLLEWELRHNTLIKGENALAGALEDLQAPEVWALLDRWETGDLSEEEAAATPVWQELPQWQSALGEISVLL